MYKKGVKEFFWSVSDYYASNTKRDTNIIAGQDGLYEIRDAAFGRMVTKTEFVRELEPIQPGFQFSLPKIPGALLEMIIAFFRSLVTENFQLEAMVYIYWDRENQNYFLECPYQLVSKAGVEAVYNPALQSCNRFIHVAEIHSHNTMEAFFSKVDDANEQAFRIYGVIGKLDCDPAEMKLRVGYNGKYIPLPLEYIFDQVNLSPSSKRSFPIMWYEKIRVAEGIL
jgi:PRTRC genetic system protein A